jgi:4-hydroxy-tetrahydrodipicolinate synthase
MAKSANFSAQGVIPACLLPFDHDMEIDAPAFRSHLRDVSAVDGLSAITINAHSTEVNSCSDDEQARVLAIAGEEVGDRLPIVHGVYADGSLEAGRIAAAAQRGGASALLVFPPNSMSMGGQLRPDMARAHFGAVVERSDLPVILFQYPIESGLGYPIDTMVGLLETFPSIVAIKDWCNDPLLHQRHIQVLHSLSRRVSVLSTHSSWLMPSLCMGCDGLLSGMGSVTADLQVAMWRAVRAGDLKRAQALNEQLFPLARLFYQPPFLDMHNRMKEALVLLGRLERAVVRPPLVKIPVGEVAEIAAALKLAQPATQITNPAA